MFYAPAQDTQRPTHPRLHVRDARDAHTVFEAVRQGLLKPVVRRLNELERATYIQSGAIFVWEESDDEMGLKRWTDNRGGFAGAINYHRAGTDFFATQHGHKAGCESRTYSTTKKSRPTSHSRQ